MMNIEAKDLTLRYGKVTAVDGLSVRLEGGRIYGLLGRNGSGKTSLLSALAGFLPATEGKALLDGAPVFENPFATRQICLIRERADTVDHEWPTNRVRDALELAATARPRWDAEYASRLVERFRISPDDRVDALSRGQRSALACTLGLAARAPVTFFDETHLGMDAGARDAFYAEILEDYMAHPRTLVLATHLIEEVDRLLEEVVLIDRGRLVMHEPVDDLRARGAAVMGPAEAVDRFTEGLTIMSERRLGPTKAATVMGPLDDPRRSQAREAGLELGPVGLQELFIHLTEPREDR